MVRSERSTLQAAIFHEVTVVKTTQEKQKKISNIEQGIMNVEGKQRVRYFF